MNLEKTLIDSMARTLFVCAYADQQESRAEDGLRAKLAKGGEDWFDVAPKTPAIARDEALKLWGRIEERNYNMFSLLYTAAKADGMDPNAFEFAWDEEYVKSFGHYLVMGSLGHGVSWFDDHKKFELTLPDIEFSL